jgi:membrane-associated protein
MNAGNHLLDYILHSDVYLNAFVSTYGFWTYLALFIIVFCETGFIITPFLPGDSLLFAAGSIAAQDTNSLNCFLLLFLLVIAAILGNELNFIAGSTLGSRLLNAKNTWFFNKKHLINAHQFYTRHGGKTIFFARFLPIIRTFAPFIAGLG